MVLGELPIDSYDISPCQNQYNMHCMFMQYSRFEFLQILFFERSLRRQINSNSIQFVPSLP